MPCPCTNLNAELSATAVSKLPVTKSLRDDSHLIITLRLCSCGQHWLTIFTELIDWQNGDDSQARAYIPISSSEADRFRAQSAPIAESHITDLTSRRYPMMVWPRGGSKGYQWMECKPVILPHD